MGFLVTLFGEKFTEKMVGIFLRFGIAGIFAGVLLGVFIGDVRADQRATRQEHAEYRAEAVARDAEAQQRELALKNLLGQILMASERTAYLQRRQCINTARTRADLEACARDAE